MGEIAKKLGVGIDAVVYFMRKNKILRRSLKENNALLFEKKKLSFKENRKLSLIEEKLKLIKDEFSINEKFNRTHFAKEIGVSREYVLRIIKKLK
jgi:hypothetical protein